MVGTKLDGLASARMGTAGGQLDGELGTLTAARRIARGKIARTSMPRESLAVCSIHLWTGQRQSNC
jgi:hypothetical protein